MRPRMLFVRLVTTLLVCLGSATVLFPQPASIPLSVELPDNPMAGARLFVQKGCVHCHALGGEQRLVGPDLGRIRFPGSVLDLAAALWNHSPVMREKMRDLKIQRPELTSHEMADLAAFLTAYRYYLTEVGETGDAAEGRRVFVAKGCARCHGSADDRDKAGPSLERYQGRFSAILLAQAMWNHGSEMASAMASQQMPWPKFDEREMGDLLVYLQAGQTGTRAERVYFEPGSPRRGRELFSTKRCNVCHAIAGAGGRGGPDLSTRPELVGSMASVAGLMWNHSLVMTAEFRRRDIPRVGFSGQEMADIIAYLYFVNYATVRGTPATGARVFAEKCSACHSASEEGRFGPTLANLPNLEGPLALLAAMWNHAVDMEQETQRRGLPWPRLEAGEAADVAAYMLSERDAPPPRVER